MKAPFKNGATVVWTRRNGTKAKGRVAGYDETPKGVWVAVNTADKGKNPVVTKVRPSLLSLA